MNGHEQNNETGEGPTPTTQQAGWRLPLFLAVVLVGVVLIGRFLREPAPQPAERGEIATVTIGDDFVEQSIEQGSGPPEPTRYAWREGMTVLDLLLASDAKAKVSGAGANAFVTAINGRENGGAGGAGWQFWVNGDLAEVGAGVRPLANGDRVLWRHAPYE